MNALVHRHSEGGVLIVDGLHLPNRSRHGSEGERCPPVTLLGFDREGDLNGVGAGFCEMEPNPLGVRMKLVRTILRNFVESNGPEKERDIDAPFRVDGNVASPEVAGAVGAEGGLDAIVLDRKIIDRDALGAGLEVVGEALDEKSLTAPIIAVGRRHGVASCEIETHAPLRAKREGGAREAFDWWAYLEEARRLERKGMHGAGRNLDDPLGGPFAFLESEPEFCALRRPANPPAAKPVARDIDDPISVAKVEVN